MEFLICIIGFVIGFAISWITCNYFRKSKLSGTLTVYNSDPNDGHYLFLEITEDPKALMNKKEVLLNVKNENYIPRKKHVPL